MALNIVLGLVLLTLIVLSSGVVIDLLEKFVLRLPLGKSKVISILIGFSLALPELFVGIAAAMDGKPQLSFGNVIGANMANLSLIIGGLAVLTSVVPIVGEYKKKDFWLTIGLVMMPLLLLFDGVISKMEGLMLVVLYFVYAFCFAESRNMGKQSAKKIGLVEKIGMVVILALGLIILAVCSWQLVQVSVVVAASWGVSWFWMGLLLVSFGTTLPELLLLSTSRKKNKASLALNDLLGSVVMNSTLILGIVAVISPIVMRESLQRGVTGVFMIFTLGLFWLFTKSKRKLERWEGVVLIGIYLMFVGLQFILA